MAKRKSTGKRLRFEIFKRDGFTCQYCGQQPPDVALVVDHIVAVSAGGDNDVMNLVTACDECNQGKSNRPLGEISPKPDADLKWLETQQEIAELRRYQDAKQERDDIMANVVASLQETWANRFNDKSVPADSEILKWLTRGSPEDVERAIEISSSKAFKLTGFVDRLKYTAAVLRNITTEQD